MKRTPSVVALFRVAWFGAMSSGDAPNTAGVGSAGKDGTACAGSAGKKKKREPDLWNMLYVAKPVQNAAGGHHHLPPCSFVSKEVAEPQPALDPGEESDNCSYFSDEDDSKKDLRQDLSDLAGRLANEQVCHRCLPKRCLFCTLTCCRWLRPIAAA